MSPANYLRSTNKLLTVTVKGKRVFVKNYIILQLIRLTINNFI